jgi:hypothetical protein
MIPADHFGPTVNGEAWWVMDEAPHSGLNAIDRPCDTCDGSGLRVASSPDGREVYHGPGLCPDCDGTGRHTFDIEVACEACGDRHDIPIGNSSGGATYRVSVVLGMVLPIVDVVDECPEHSHLCVFYDRRTNRWSFSDDTKLDPVTALPPDAKPGMWAVKVAVK